MVSDIQLVDIIRVLIDFVNYLAAVRAEIPITDIASFHQSTVELLALVSGSFYRYTEQLCELDFSQGAVDLEESVGSSPDGAGVFDGVHHTRIVRADFVGGVDIFPTRGALSISAVLDLQIRRPGCSTRRREGNAGIQSGKRQYHPAG